jgi:polysaccharide deacetylase 2 family uncharacterized protein YibQ
MAPGRLREYFFTYYRQILLIVGILVLILFTLVLQERRQLHNIADQLRGTTIFLDKFRKQLLEADYVEALQFIPSQAETYLAFYQHDPCDSCLNEIVKKAAALNELTVQKVSSPDSGIAECISIKYHHQSIGTLYLLEPQMATIPTRIVKPQLAIIIDDFGYSNSQTIQDFIDLPIALTISVIPGIPYTNWVIQAARSAGKEIIIHMPMQAENHKKANDVFTLNPEQNPTEIRERLEHAYREIPFAKGLSNHQGSLATADERLMQTVAQFLKSHYLYFIDSYTSAKSVGYKICRESGVSTAIRTVFLDNKRNINEIREQFEKARRFAEKNGFAVAIGHIYPETLAALTALLRDGDLDSVIIVFGSKIVLCNK